MNPTDEFLLEAFKQQGLLTDETLSEINASLSPSEEENEVEKELELMDLSLIHI